MIAVIAFIALDDPDEDIPQDTYTLAADEICVDAKKRIARAGVEALGAENPAAFPRALVPLMAQWRSEFGNLQVPGGRGEPVEALDDALLDVEVKSAELSRLAREGDRKEFAAAAVELDERTGAVETAIADLELQRCSRIKIAPGASGQGNQ
jgi:hypothetical protein